VEALLRDLPGLEVRAFGAPKFKGMISVELLSRSGIDEHYDASLR